MEGDPDIRAATEKAGIAQNMEEIVAGKGARVEESLGYDLQTAVIERRWGFVSGVTAEAVSRDLSIKTHLSLSDRIDRVVTSRTLGLPLFFLVAWAVFRLTYMIGDPLVGVLEGLVEILGDRAAGILGAAGASDIIS